MKVHSTDSESDTRRSIFFTPLYFLALPPAASVPWTLLVSLFSFPYNK